MAGSGRSACVRIIAGSGKVCVHDSPCSPAPCPADTSGAGAVAVEDLVTVILTWGTCP
jgi:hypothetical protein